MKAIFMHKLNVLKLFLEQPFFAIYFLLQMEIFTISPMRSIASASCVWKLYFTNKQQHSTKSQAGKRALRLLHSAKGAMNKIKAAWAINNEQSVSKRAATYRPQNQYKKCTFYRICDLLKNVNKIYLLTHMYIAKLYTLMH